jgi:hypothetical protein
MPLGFASHCLLLRSYLSRFPQSAELFSFADFSLFAIWPDSIRFVGGFAQATTFSPETLAELLGARFLLKADARSSASWLSPLATHYG